MFHETWAKSFAEFSLQRCDVVLRTYANERLTVRGRILLPVVYGSQRASLPMVVVDVSGPTLFGRDCMSVIMLD